MSSIFTSDQLSHVDYVDYFKKLAENNKSILHTEENAAFVELLDSEGPYNYLDVEEFENEIKNLQHTFMALQSFRAQLNDLENNSPQYRVFGAFIICKKIDSKEYDNRAIRGPAIDECQAICESILGWIQNEAYQIGLENGCMFELKGEVGNVVIRTRSVIGKRVDFQYVRGADTIIYNEDDWGTPFV